MTVLRRYFFCGSFMFLFCLVFAMSLCASVYMCFVVTCWERADLLALVCGVCCEFVTFPLVSWVRCDTWLYRFLIFAPLLTLLCLQIPITSVFTFGQVVFTTQSYKIVSEYKSSLVSPTCTNDTISFFKYFNKCKLICEKACRACYKWHASV